jgi:hypothetical protein
MIKEILRLKSAGLGAEKVAAALGISKNTVKSYVRKHQLAATDGVPGPLVTALDGSAPMPSYSAPWSPMVDWPKVKDETDQGAQLSQLWEEWIRASDDRVLSAVPYVSFWREYKRRFHDVPLDLHRDFPPGERLEADYKGDAPHLGYIDRGSGAYVECQLFGATMAFSQLFYAEATHTQKQPDFLRALGNAFTYVGGVTATTVVDNAKVAVSKAHRYDPDFHPEFAYFCEHYKTAHLAARPVKPKDKCFVENSLEVFWRWARRRFRQRTFYSLAELNAFLHELLELFNNRIQRKYGKSRRQKFELAERAKLLPLPATAYSIGTWSKHKLHPDCHVQVGKNFFSGPHQLRGYELDIRVSHVFIEIFHRLERVAVHRAFAPNNQGRYRTDNRHLPEKHLAVKEFTPQRALAQAKEIGPATDRIISRLILNAIHPLLYLRRAQGIIRLASRYTAADLEYASMQVVEIGVDMPRIGDLERIIKNAKVPGAAPSQTEVRRGPNPNLRGQQSWSQV